MERPFSSKVIDAVYSGYSGDSFDPDAAIDAVLELLPEPTVQPSVEDIERCLNAEFGPFLAHAPYDPARFWRQSAHAVLALIGGRTEREVLAQGWDEGAEAMDEIFYWHDGGRELNPYRKEANRD